MRPDKAPTLKFEIDDDPYAEMTVSDRVKEYRKTGDVDVLNTEAARILKVSPEEMQRVEGATEKDIEDSFYWELPEQPELIQDKDEILEYLGLLRDEHLGFEADGIYMDPDFGPIEGIYDPELERVHQEYLSRYGIDSDALERLKDQDIFLYLNKLFAVASAPIALDDRTQRDDDREAAEYATDLIFEYLISYQNSVNTLFSFIQYGSADGMKELQIIHDMFRRSYDRFMAISNDRRGMSESGNKTGHRLAEILNEFSNIFHHRYNAAETPADINYLTDRYFFNFCIEGKFSEPMTLDEQEMWLASEMGSLERLADLDRNGLIPFEIEEGKLALFGHGNTVLFVADKETSASFRTKFQILISQIHYDLVGQPNARRVIADAPEDLVYECQDFIDAASVLGTKFSEFSTDDPSLIRDYTFMMQVDMRETVERDFNISLKQLSIKEQIYFLQFLQHTTVAEAETMQHFTGTFGVAGMRTFLAMQEKGFDFGDKIVAFGRHEGAREVFESYGELLDKRVEQAELIRSEFDCETVDCDAFVAAMEKQLFGKANEYLVEQISKSEAGEDISVLTDELTHKLVMAEVINTALRNKTITSVEAMKGFRDELLSGAEVIEHELEEELVGIYEDNYLRRYQYSKEGAEQLVINFRESLRRPQTKVFLWRVGETVLGFITAEQQQSGAVYVGGLNSNAAFTTNAGPKLIKMVFSEYPLESTVLTAEATVENAAAYSQLYNFVSYTAVTDPDEGFVLKQISHPRWEFQTQKEKRGQILSYLESSDMYRSSGNRVVAYRTKDTTFVPPELDGSYVITRIFQDKKDGSRVFVLEKAPEDLMQFIEQQPTDSQMPHAA